MSRYEVRVTAAEAAHVLDVPLSELLDLVEAGQLVTEGEHPDQTLDLDEVEAFAVTRWSTRSRVRRRSAHTYFVAVAGAAEILGVSRQRVKQLTAAGRIPYLTTTWGDRIYRREQLEVVANARLARGLGKLGGRDGGPAVRGRGHGPIATEIDGCLALIGTGRRRSNNLEGSCARGPRGGNARPVRSSKLDLRLAGLEEQPVR